MRVCARPLPSTQMNAPDTGSTCAGAAGSSAASGPCPQSLVPRPTTPSRTCCVCCSVEPVCGKQPWEGLSGSLRHGPMPFRAVTLGRLACCFCILMPLHRADQASLLSTQLCNVTEARSMRPVAPRVPPPAMTMVLKLVALPGCHLCGGRAASALRGLCCMVGRVRMGEGRGTGTGKGPQGHR